MFVPLLQCAFFAPGATAAPPVITSIAPNIGPLAGRPGRVITGTGFTSASAVSVNGIAAQSFVVDSDTQITAVLDDEVSYGAHDVVVTTPAGTDTLTGGYEHWEPQAETVQALYKKGFYANPGTPTWTATVGTNLTGVGAGPWPAALDGAPNAEFSTDLSLGNAVSLTTFFGTGNHTAFICFRAESIVTGSTQYLLSDSGGYIAVRLYKTGSNYKLEFEEWDAGQHLATFDITSLVNATTGAGFLILQVKKTGGNIYARAVGATGTGSWGTGVACGTTGSGAGALRVGGSGSIADGIIYMIGTKTAAWSDTAAAKFEAFCQAEYGP